MELYDICRLSGGSNFERFGRMHKNIREGSLKDLRLRIKRIHPVVEIALDTK